MVFLAIIVLGICFICYYYHTTKVTKQEKLNLSDDDTVHITSNRHNTYDKHSEKRASYKDNNTTVIRLAMNVNEAILPNYKSHQQQHTADFDIYIGEMGYGDDNHILTSFREFKFATYSIYTKDMDIMFDNNLNSPYYDVLYVLDSNRYLVVLVMIKTDGIPHNLTNHVNLSLCGISNLFERNIILFLDMTRFISTKETTLLNSFGNVKILFNQIQIEWTNIGVNYIENEETPSQQKGITPPPPQPQTPSPQQANAIKLIDSDDAFGFQNEFNGILVLKNKQQNTGLFKRAYRFIENLYT